MVIGNFHGFNAYSIENTRSPRLLASVVCPGGQGDVSIYGNLLFMSVEQTRGRIDCGVQGVQEPLGAPEKARVVNRPRIFADDKSGEIAGLFPGGDHGPGTQRTSTTPLVCKRCPTR